MIMNQGSLLTTALCLSESDAKALISGRSIAALSRTFTNAISTFAICSVGEESSLITAWATLDSCRMYTDLKDAEALAWNTIWSMQFLHSLLEEKHRIFLNILRVHQLPQPVQLHESRRLDTIGGFIKLRTAISYTSTQAVLSHNTFSQRKQQLNNLQPPLYPELEELERQISQLYVAQPSARNLGLEIENFLGWNFNSRLHQANLDLDWIVSINELGNRSQETEEDKKSNWQAGTDFENIVKQSLEFLGFQIDETHRGGAGGLDFFCSRPYPLTGECKSGKKIPSGTTEELIKLGGMRLPSTNDFLASAKIIIGPGNPSPDVVTAADKWRVSIIKPMTLQKLIELHAQFPIDLFELKDYLKPGQIDDGIELYIENHTAKIQIRAHIVKTLKKYLEDQKGDSLTKVVDVSFERFCGVYDSSNPPQKLSDKALKEILIELSSPLAGYLGRVSNTDRFYFLRELQVN
jgi:hypothetical protein